MLCIHNVEQVVTMYISKHYNSNVTPQRINTQSLLPAQLLYIVLYVICSNLIGPAVFGPAVEPLSACDCCPLWLEWTPVSSISTMSLSSLSSAERVEFNQAV
jgi:hypothetical protein